MKTCGVCHEHTRGRNNTFITFCLQEFTPDFDDTFDSAYDANAPVPGDSGYNNPLYSDMYVSGKPADIEEVNSAEPPSFMDAVGVSAEELSAEVGVSAEDFSASFDSSEFHSPTANPAHPTANPAHPQVQLFGEYDDSKDKGDSEA